MYSWVLIIHVTRVHAWVATDMYLDDNRHLLCTTDAKSPPKVESRRETPLVSVCMPVSQFIVRAAACLLSCTADIHQEYHIGVKVRLHS